MSLGTSKRGIWPFDLFGDTAIPCVRRSNVHLARTALLVLVCIVRQVWWAVEQPGTSRLPQIQYFASILEDPALPTEFSRLPESYWEESETNMCTIIPSHFSSGSSFRHEWDCLHHWVGWGCFNTSHAKLLCFLDHGTPLRNLRTLASGIHIWKFRNHDVLFFWCGWRRAIPKFKNKMTKKRRQQIKDLFYNSTLCSWIGDPL